MQAYCVSHNKVYLLRTKILKISQNLKLIMSELLFMSLLSQLSELCRETYYVTPAQSQEYL